MSNGSQISDIIHQKIDQHLQQSFVTNMVFVDDISYDQCIQYISSNVVMSLRFRMYNTKS